MMWLVDLASLLPPTSPSPLTPLALQTAPFCAAAPGTSINGAKFPSLPPEAQARTDIRPRVLKPSWDDIEAAAAAAVAAANQASNGATASPQAPPAPPAKPALRGVVEAYASKVEDEVKATEAQVHVEPIPALDSGVGRGYDAVSLLPPFATLVCWSP